MFVESEFSWSIVVQPHQFKDTLQIQKALIRNLLRRFDNTKCTEEHGYFVTVTSIENVGEGTIREGKGYVTYPVSFRGLTFKPFKGEIVFGTVSKVKEEGVAAEFGPGEFLVAGTSDGGHMGEYKFVKEGKGVWKHKNGTQIEQGTTIRAEIMDNTWFQTQNTFRTHCSLNGEFLGVVNLPSTKKSGGAGEATEQVGTQSGQV